MKLYEPAGKTALLASGGLSWEEEEDGGLFAFVSRETCGGGKKRRGAHVWRWATYVLLSPTTSPATSPTATASSSSSRPAASTRHHPPRLATHALSRSLGSSFSGLRSGALPSPLDFGGGYPSSEPGCPYPPDRARRCDLAGTLGGASSSSRMMGIVRAPRSELCLPCASRPGRCGCCGTAAPAAAAVIFFFSSGGGIPIVVRPGGTGKASSQSVLPSRRS